MNKIKNVKVCILMLLVVMLFVSCQLNKENSLADFPDSNMKHSDLNTEESEHAIKSENVLDTQETEPMEVESSKFKFNPPTYSHELGEEFLDFINSFSGEFIFPQFDSVATIDFYPFSVSSNLYQLVISNEEVEALGMGVNEEIKEEAYQYLAGPVVSYDAINYMGKQYFGENFNIPYGTEGYEIKPLPTNDRYLGLHSGRGGMGYVAYYLLDVTHDDDTYTATFLPYFPEGNWDDGTILDVSFPNLSSNAVNRIRGEIDYPENITTEDKLKFDYMNNLYITIKQEQLDTISVTFKEENGKFIAISSTYNINMI